MRQRRLQDFGPYRIVRQIAVGGMAEIYLARQRGLEGIERTVVVKRILEKHAHDAEFVTMFLDEARLLAALSHPNIAQVFDVGQVEETYYLVMEHVRGPTLGKLLAAAREGAGLPRREALGIGLAVAEALHYVHERRDELGRPLDIVHRDLNPANVIVSYDGGVKLIDFGIAKGATKVYETRTGVVKGTYGYIAPEQLIGETAVDRRADVFALGILLYEMCVGTHPYDVSDEPNLIHRILEARYRRPRELRPDIPVDLDRLIAACLAPHPEGRPESVAVLIDALARHLAEQGMVPTQTSIAQVARTLVPDDEGPRPMPRVSKTAPRRRLDPTGTRKVRAPDAALTRPTRSPDPWAEPTVDLGPKPLGGKALVRVGEEGHEDESAPTHPLNRLEPHPAPEDEELPTTLMTAQELSPGSPAVARRPQIRKRGGGDSATWIPPKQRKRISRAALALLALSGLFGAGLLAFVTARAVGVRDGAELPAPPLQPVRDEPPRAIVLNVVSEPTGASVHADGRPQPERTPVALTLPPGTRTVWLRIEKTGYVVQEREVSATVGEARFVLSALAVDAGPSLAPAPPQDAGSPPPPRPRRRRRR